MAHSGRVHAGTVGPLHHLVRIIAIGRGLRIHSGEGALKRLTVGLLKHDLDGAPDGADDAEVDGIEGKGMSGWGKERVR